MSRLGYSPSRGRCRDEIILIQVCDRRHTTLRIWKIECFLLTGVVRDLVPIDLGNDAESTFGRPLRQSARRAGALKPLPIMTTQSATVTPLRFRRQSSMTISIAVCPFHEDDSGGAENPW
jgi:hypothetical protein